MHFIIRFSFLAVVVAATTLASNAVAPINLEPCEKDNGDGTRNFVMWADDTQTSTIVKFMSVPYTYDVKSAKHADCEGAFAYYNDGTSWLILNSKRLFQVPLDNGDVRAQWVSNQLLTPGSSFGATRSFLNECLVLHCSAAS